MVEVLITMLVMTVGLLGFASMQIYSLKDNQSALFRSQAVILSYDMLDLMRTNRMAANAGDYDILLNVNPPTGDAMAEQNLRSWRNALTNRLPVGKGSIQRNGNLLTVTVQWDDSRGENPALQFVVTTQL